MGIWRIREAFPSVQMRVVRGDAEIDTQPDKSTRVSLEVTTPTFRKQIEGHFRCGFFVLYRVEELGGDRSILEGEGEVSFPIPEAFVANGWPKVQFAPYKHTWEVRGVNHSWMPIPATDGTCIVTGSYIIDHKGPDLLNANVKGSVAFQLKHK